MIGIGIGLAPGLTRGGVALAYLLDQFSGTDGTLLTAREADTGQSWTARSNNFEIASNKARAKAVASGDPCIATVTSPFGTNVTVEIKFTRMAVTQRPTGIVGRYVDANNYWRIAASGAGNGFQIVERTAGVETIRSFANPTITNTTEYTMRVVFAGNVITATIGASTITYTSASHNTATQFGLYGQYDTTVSARPVFNDFLLWEGAAAPPANPLYPFSLTSPSAYQIYQRDGSNLADIEIAGTFVATTTHDIEARFNGGAWATIAVAASASGFSGTLTGQAAGQGALDVRFVDDTTKNYSVSYVGIGDVFVIAGQSNAVGISGAAKQTYSHATLKAGLFGNDYQWRNLVDPVDTSIGQIDTVSADAEAVNGSYWPLLATQIMASTGLPVAFVPCPKAATPILSWQPGADHQDRSTLYGSMVYRALQQAEGIRAVLWHQGESDATTLGFTGGTTYNSRLDTLANAVNADLGVKLIAAKIHKWDGSPTTSQGQVDEINTAIGDAWVDNANVLAGPNFDSPTRVTSNLHFTTAAELQEAANRWWAAINALAIL